MQQFVILLDIVFLFLFFIDTEEIKSHENQVV